MPGIVTVTDKDFEDVVLKSTSGRPFLVYFWAPWAGPCTEMSRHIEQIAEEHHELVVAKINADEGHDVVQQYGVQALPSLMVIHEGQNKGTWQGFMTKDTIESKVL
ncbi:MULTISPECIES: thioredoxin family protein [Streptomyces]|uniref:thioredoxin family protein n=1 Tax=Streptomyces TaxID=1883 RepID=UPI0012929EDE|nr:MULTISPECIES: thioredoxin family protein [Streptomyces]MCX5037582.1 thioredoxin family protein [Streptomyces coelicoflavus]QFX83707.1 redoxin domain-containing protein [Streptomyces sp. SYP-A7193]